MSDDKKVSKPSYEDFYHGATHGKEEHVPIWGLILGTILRGIKR